MVYLDIEADDQGGILQVEMIDQLSNKYLVKELVVYLDVQADDQGGNLQIEMITSTW